MLRATIQRLESLRRAGLTHLPKAKNPPASAPERRPPVTDGARPAATAPIGIAPPIPPTPGARPAVARQPRPESAGPSSSEIAAVAPASSADPRAAALAAVARDVAACTRCRELARTRTQTVFGVGNPHARLVFCGEAPGADEDRLGEPFVGRAGQWLTDIIVKGMQMRREDVYILNILRCRPPGNRNPLPVEAAACREFLDRQLEIIQPEFICCLGAVAAQNLLGSDAPIGRLRGRMHDLHGIKVLCTYHPAYLLRNPAAKRFVWDDIKLLLAEMAKGERRE